VGLAAGEEMEKLAKEVMALPPAVLERMKKYRGIMLGPGITARHVAFALFYSPPRRGRARVGVHRNVNSAMGCAISRWRGARIPPSFRW
jgi:hypothetical protein